MRYSFLKSLGLLMIIALSSCAASRVTHTLKQNLKNPVFAHSFTGIMFYDLQKEKVLFEQNGDKYFTPASNMKLFTFYAGLKFIGDSIQGLKYRETKDSLIFTGTGDPSFLNPNLPASKVYFFLKKSPKQLYYYPSKFYGEKFGPGWAWDDYNYAFSAERSSFPIYGNVAEVSFSNISEARITPILFQNSLHKLDDTLNKFNREEENNVFFYKILKETLQKKRYIPFKYSPELFVQMLADTLRKPVKLIQQKPQLNKTIYSIPADSLYKTMLQESDNFMAEQLLYLVSRKISDTLTIDQTTEFLNNNLLKNLPNEPVWVDGSGLSRYNLVTPRDLVFLLKKIHKEIPEKRLFELLPVGGKSGTLKNQFKNEPPFVFAKTGSLSNNYCLSGYLKTRKGKIIVFSFMNNNFVRSSSEIKAAMEKILFKIYREN